MKPTLKNLLLTFLVLVSCTKPIFSQSPGIIVRTAGGPYSTVLDPNQNGFTSLSINGFVGGDVGASYSEIPYKVVPPVVTEPTGDLATGPSGGFTDIVKTVDNSGFYIYYDGTNILLRLRIGTIISGSKGYSILFDTDGKIGNSGPYADPNYIAPTNTSNGNPGFEYEVVLETNSRVAVYNVDGLQNPVLLNSYTLANNSLISVALSTDSGNPDYFYDWYVPLTALGSPSSFRMVATTVTSPSSALQGSRSDIYGIDDASYPGVSGGWQSVINSQPTINVTDIGSGGSGVGAVCTAAPTLNTPILPGSSVSVTGTWTRLDATKPSTATITLYKNGVSQGTTTVGTGNTWTIVVASIASGDVFYAKAQAAAESQCLQSNNVVSGCSSVPTAPVLTCASSKGISGTIQSGNTILVYLLPTTNASPTSIPLTTNITYPTATTFAYYVNGCSGGASNVGNGTYMLIASNGSCTSTPVFECINSGSSALTGLATNAISVTTPIYPYQTSISGTGVASGNILHLFINGQYKSTITASASSFTFTGLTLNASDQIKIYLYSGSGCMTVSNTFTVSCYTQPPIITTNINGNLLSSATSVSGTSAYAGASVTLYKGTSPSGVSVGTTSTNASGNWTISSLTLTAAENYYATQTVTGCTSPSSSSASVLAPTTVCPLITSSVSETSTSVSGTLPITFTGTVRIYLDGTLLGSTSITSANTWTINAPFTYPLYAGGVISVTAQASGGAAENFTCSSTVTVSCTSPLTPDITPTSTTILTGQTVTFNVSTITSNTWYALLDNSGVSYATSVYRTSTASFNLTTAIFNTVGTYNLNLSADKLMGCGASYKAASIVVSAVLPVTLISFEAAWMNGSVKLKWATSSEQNVSHFEIEKSLDGNIFTFIGSVSAAGNSQATNNYEFIDQDPGENKIYYRLKTVDLDGNKKYSKIIKLTLKPIIITSATPNPFTTDLSLKIVLSKTEQLTVRLFDAVGKQMLLYKTQGQQGLNTIGLHELGYLTKGLYLLSISSEDQAVAQKY